MRTQLKVDATLERHLERNWTNGVAIFYENNMPKNPPDEYVNYMSMLGSSDNVSIGRDANKRKFRTIIAEVRIQKGTGKGRATKLVQEFSDIFENQILDSFISTFTANESEAHSPSHYGINVAIPYYWDSK